MEQIQANKDPKKLINRKDVTSNVFKKPTFDTKIYYYYFTEIRKDKN